jgi:hypothetical protein
MRFFIQIPFDRLPDQMRKTLLASLRSDFQELCTLPVGQLDPASPERPPRPSPELSYSTTGLAADAFTLRPQIPMRSKRPVSSNEPTPMRPNASVLS